MPARARLKIDKFAVIQQKLLGWFRQHGRDLPWRNTRDPYHVLVSEIMLQQTQVERVKPKYAAFLAEFPTLEALAQAPVAAVIKAWQGLGYNRRAVNLQRAAQAILRDHGGQFPRTPQELRELPGIGAYTAGAVACFAFEQDVAFLDTNIRRVVRRLLVGPEEQPSGEAALVALAEQAVPAGQGWAWNQAIMELGALICTAATPACWRCPLREECADYAARSSADTALFDQPAPSTAPARPARRVAEQPFTSSNRYFRGRAVDALRQLPERAALTLAALGPLVKPGFEQAELAWLAKVVEGLVADGLACWRDRLDADLAGWQVALPD